MDVFYVGFHLTRNGSTKSKQYEKPNILHQKFEEKWKKLCQEFTIIQREFEKYH